MHKGSIIILWNMNGVFSTSGLPSFFGASNKTEAESCFNILIHKYHASLSCLLCLLIFKFNLDVKFFYIVLSSSNPCPYYNFPLLDFLPLKISYPFLSPLIVPVSVFSAYCFFLSQAHGGFIRSKRLFFKPLSNGLILFTFSPRVLFSFLFPSYSAYSLHWDYVLSQNWARSDYTATSAIINKYSLNTCSVFNAFLTVCKIREFYSLPLRSFTFISQDKTH